jgi:hypothetical protein
MLLAFPIFKAELTITPFLNQRPRPHHGGGGVDRKEHYLCTDKKENKIFLIYKEIHMGSGAKSYVYE